MAKALEYSRGGLTKRYSKGGWKWSGQVKWRYVGETKWRTKEKMLRDESGQPIPADARNIDPNTKKDKNRRNVRAAQSAYEAWFGSLSAVERDGTTTVGDYLKSHIKTLERQAQAAQMNNNERAHMASTLRGYREYIPIISEGFGNTRMAQVGSADVYKWIEGMKESGMAASTMRKAFSILSGACDRAVSAGDLPANPCTRENRNRIPKTALAEPNALSPIGVERVNALLDATNNPRLRIGARLALACGLRAGEVCGLRWCDIDTEHDLLHVREAVANAGGGTEVGTPKSRAGIRDVDIPLPLVRELTEWREAQHADWQNAADGQESESVPFESCRVIGYADGTWFTPNALGHLWNRLAKGRHERDSKDRRKAGPGYIEGHEPIVGMTGEQIRLHDLRHSYATYHIATGTNVVMTATLMGHADPAVTMRRYAGRIKDRDTLEAISGKSASDVLTAGSSWAEDVNQE